MKRARQAEILKAIQKDSLYTNELTEDLSDLLKFGTKPRIWIKYNQLCKFLAEISYFGFASINRIQTLGEEYTGIIQVDEKFSLPKKSIQLMSIILEYGGEALYLKVLSKFEKDIKYNNEIRPEAKNILLKLISIMRYSIDYVKGFHRTWFYFNASKYHISKRIFGINYILIRNWLHSNQVLSGYRILGFLTFSQLILAIILNMWKFWNKSIQNESKKLSSHEIDDEIYQSSSEIRNTCNLCLEITKDTSLTICGHLFCWTCIIEWLGEKPECPVCREPMKKSNVIQLMNYG